MIVLPIMVDALRHASLRDQQRTFAPVRSTDIFCRQQIHRCVSTTNAQSTMVAAINFAILYQTIFLFAPVLSLDMHLEVTI